MPPPQRNSPTKTRMRGSRSASFKVRQSSQFAGSIDARDYRIRFDDQLVATVNLVEMPHSNFANFDNGGRQLQPIIELGGSEILHVHFGDDQHSTVVFDRFVIVSEIAQHLDTTTLEVIQVVGMVDSTLPIRFLIGHAKSVLMRGQRIRHRD
mgnify:CR=1 FL=1